jgi:hypothetical protein
MTGYETPTPQLDDDNATLSSHSSLSDLSHAETLEPNTEGNNNTFNKIKIFCCIKKQYFSHI